MATFCMCQCQDGDEVLKVMNEDVRTKKDTLENLNTQKSTSRRILTGILLKKFWTYAKFKLQTFERGEFSINTIQDIHVKKSKIANVIRHLWN